VLRCSGRRFGFREFLIEIEVDLTQLPDIFPLLISTIWQRDGY
jgi:hypothetical protein